MVEKKYTIVFSKRAEKDKKLIKAAGYEKKVREILQKLMIDPYYNPLDFLQGNLKGFYSKRINVQHRIVYEVLEEEKVVRIARMWTHYDKI